MAYEGGRRVIDVGAKSVDLAATAKSAPQGAPAAPREREALLAWLAASTQQLLEALREAGPDRGCWTSRGESQSPQTCGAADDEEPDVADASARGAATELLHHSR